MRSAVRVIGETVGWLLTILGWVVAVPFGLVSLGLLLMANPYLIYFAPFCALGVGVAALGQSVRRSCQPHLHGRPSLLATSLHAVPTYSEFHHFVPQERKVDHVRQ